MEQFTFTRQSIDDVDFLVVRGSAVCGTEFELGVIYEPHSLNPILELALPFGMNGLASLLEALLEAFEDWRTAQSALLN